MKPEQHRDLLASLLGREGPVLACSYRNDIYDEVLLGAGWTVLEASARAEHGHERVEALYLNAHATVGRVKQVELLEGIGG